MFEVVRKGLGGLKSTINLLLSGVEGREYAVNKDFVFIASRRRVLGTNGLF